MVIDAGKDKPAAFATMYFNRGEAYREKGDLDNAIKDLGASIDLDNKNANAYFGRGTALRSKGSSTAPSPTSNRRSGSITRTRRTTAPAATPITRSATTSAPSPT